MTREEADWVRRYCEEFDLDYAEKRITKFGKNYGKVIVTSGGMRYSSYAEWLTMKGVEVA